jgi:hypothetical protein
LGNKIEEEFHKDSGKDISGGSEKEEESNIFN